MNYGKMSFKDTMKGIICIVLSPVIMTVGLVGIFMPRREVKKGAGNYARLGHRVLPPYRKG